MQKKGGIMFTGFNWQQMISAFIVLFAVIDIIGSIPIIINLKEKGKDVNATKATVISFALLIGFFYAGETFSCRYRIIRRGGRIRYFPHVSGNDSGYRNLQKSGADKGSDTRSACLPAAGRGRSFYYASFASCRICQC